MNSIITELDDIPDIPLDSAIPAEKYRTYGMIYKESDSFFLIIFDPLGIIINAVEIEIPKPIEKIEFKPTTVAFCEVVLFDVFTNHTILGTIELDGPVDDILTEKLKKDRMFTKTLYDRMFKMFTTSNQIIN